MKGLPVEFVFVDGKRLDAAALLAALYNGAAIPWPMLRSADMTRDQAVKYLEGLDAFRFDYFESRPLKVRADDHGHIGDDSRRLYDRDAGRGAFDRAVAHAQAWEVKR